MKSLTKPALALIVLSGLLAMIPTSLSAQPLEKVALSATAYAANGLSTNNGTTFLTKSAIQKTITTKDILKQLTHDEYKENNLPSKKLPKDAVLNFNGTGFEIDLGTNLLVDVSDILTFKVTGTNDIPGAGTYSDATGAGNPPFTKTDIYLATITFNDTASTGKMQFTFTGTAIVTRGAPAPNPKTGRYTATGSLDFTRATGEGQTDDLGPIVLTGFTLTASGARSTE
jgi:hypothetical protein